MSNNQIDTSIQTQYDQSCNKKSPAKDPYEACCMYQKGTCGAWTYGKIPKEGLEDVSELIGVSVSNHIRNKLHLNLSDIQAIQWDEKSLIENRAGRTLLPTDKICPYHRYKLGIDYKPPKTCSYPSHTRPKSGKKAPKTETLSVSLVMSLNIANSYSYILGSAMCRTDRKIISKVDDGNESQLMETPFLNDTLPDEAENYEPEVYILDSNDHLNYSEIQNISATLNLSPVKNRILTPMDEVSVRSIRYVKRKREAFLNEAAAFFDRAVTPGQSLAYVCPETTETLSPEELVECYQNSDAFGKLVILKLVDHDKYSKTELINIFGISKWKVDQARKLKSNDKSIKLVEKVPFKRNRMNTEKSEHFLDFIFSSGLLQDVAYGTTKVKFDSGERQSVPNAILQTKYSHTIQFYIDACKENGYSPLSESSLWRILRAINPSQRKSLAGLDDITAEAMNAFQFLQGFIENLNLDKNLSQNLEKAKRYLKMNYQGHCNRFSKIVTHNTIYALSTQKEEPCLDISDEVCVDCFNLFQVLGALQTIAEGTGNQDHMYDVEQSTKSIIKYMKHQLRDEQQKQAKIFCSKQISAETAFWLRDYSQKVLPRSYREGQQSYFGKKGMSMHIDIFYTKDDSDLKKHVYYTLIYRCDQSKLETMNIADYVITEFAKDFPEVCNINGKSDNAGAYHGNQILENLYHILKYKGLKLLRYDYNEPCRGKDQCDRESSGAKSLINSFVESGNDLLQIDHVYQALHYGKGLSNSKVGVLEIDSSQSIMSGQDISGINSYHSAEFNDDNMKLFRYYGIGAGKVIKYKDAKFVPSYTPKREFSVASNCGKKKTSKRLNNKTLLFCRDASCQSTFDTIKELEEHMLTESHTSVEEISSMDKVRSSYVKKMKASSAAHLVISSTTVNTSGLTTSHAIALIALFAEVTSQGWAIPFRSTFRYTYEQKRFLYDIFMDGQTSGKKRSPEETVTSIRSHFTSTKDYVTKTQVQSLFSSFTRKLTDGKLLPPTPPTAIATTHEQEKLEDDLDLDEDLSADDIGQDMVRDVIEQVISKSVTWDIDTWVVIRYKRNWLPGMIIPKDSSHPSEEEIFVVKCMERKGSGKNFFKWPRYPDLVAVDLLDMLLQIDEPMPVQETEKLSTGEIVWCQLSKNDFVDASTALRKALREDV